MTSRKPKAKKIIIKKLPKFELDVYSKLTLSDLVVFALSYLEEHGIEATTEEIISICFRLFPHSFGLKNYPRWPDSALVIRRLNDDREKKNIKGNPTDGFALTFKGKQVAKRVAKLLGISKPLVKAKKKPVTLLISKPLRKRVRKPRLKTSSKTRLVKNPIHSAPVRKKVIQPPRKKNPVLAVIQKLIPKKPSVQQSQTKQLTTAQGTSTAAKKNVSGKSKQIQVKKEAAKSVKMEVVITPVSISQEEKVKAGKVIKQVERSDAYRVYAKNGKQAKISEFDFRNMLFATMESSSDTLIRNVGLFKRYASIYQRNDLIKFFDFCEENFSSLLKKKR